MLFNSLVFLLFGVLFYSTWFCLRQQRHRLILLVFASFLFYSYWDWRYLFILIASGIVDFSAALAMVRWPQRRGSFLIASIAVNVGALASFKYLKFAIDNGNSLFALLGLPWEFSAPAFSLVIPLGISFYTFQSMSYTIDVYRGKLQPSRSPIHFFAFLSMFPQLIAGPIERAASLLPQLEEKRKPTPEQVWEGWRYIVRGYFKKCVIADNLAPMVNQAFAHPDATASGLYWWWIAFLFALQIYGDFSGYSDIARGLGRLMGINLMRNFDHPYMARSFADFWRGWHISLSSWFRDYVYIGLGGNRLGKARTYLNLWIAMLVSGLWHGASWTFVIWGALHASFLTIEKLTSWSDRLEHFGLAGRILSTSVVLGAVTVSWVPFRAETFSETVTIWSRMFSPATLFEIPVFTGKELLFRTAVTFCLALAMMVSWLPVGLKRRSAIAPVFYAVAVTAVIYLRGPGDAFIYFQF